MIKDDGQEGVEDKMFNDMNCLENLKHIVSEFADDENIKNLSLDELRTSYEKLADNLYPVSVSSRLKYKNMLWNIDNLKPEIRSDFQAQIFNTWHTIYLDSMKTDRAEDIPVMKKQESTVVAEAEKSSEVDVREQTPDIMQQQDIESEKEALSRADLSRKEEPAKKRSPASASTVSAHQFENDWFDKFLDFFAAIIGGVSKLVGL
jgi:hypothetical protein